MEPDANSDRGGTRLTCGTDDEYEVQAPAQTTDRICVHVSDGGMSKQYELKAPTTTSDRVGAKATEHDMKTQYHVRASTKNSEECAEKAVGADEEHAWPVPVQVADAHDGPRVRSLDSALR